MKCFKTSRANTLSYLRTRNLIDKYLNILELGRFREEVSRLSEYAKQKYGIEGRLLYDEQNGTKAVPNETLFQIMDWKDGIKYPQNMWIETSDLFVTDRAPEGGEQQEDTLEQEEVEVNPLNQEQQLYQTQSFSKKELLPEVKEQLFTFLKSVNPDFRVEVVDNLSVRGLTNISEFLIQLRKGQEDSLAEETSHVFLELLTDTQLKSDLLKESERSRMYSWVFNEYSKLPAYQINGKPNYEKLKRETAAKLLSLYIQDREAFNYWSGSEQLQNNLIGLIKRFLNWIKRKVYNPFSKASLRILKGYTDGLDLALAENTEVFYDLDPRYKVFETIEEEDIRKYSKVYINLNNTLLNYKDYQAAPVGNRNAKAVKSLFFSDAALRPELDRYYSQATLTKFGRELKDKIGLINPNRVVIYTDAPITNALIERLEDEFGAVNIIRTGYNIHETLFDEFGNPVDQIISGSEKIAFLESQVRNNPKDNILFIDNRGIQLSENYPNLKVKLFSNEYAKYTDVETRQRQETLAHKHKEFSVGVIEELNQVDKDNLANLVKQSMNMVRNHIKKLERGEGYEELSEVFKDEYGNLNVPFAEPYLIKRLLDDVETWEQGLLHFTQTLESTRLFFHNANEKDYKPIRELVEEGTPESNDKAIRETAVLMRMILSWKEWVKEIRPYLNDTEFIKGVIDSLDNELSRANIKLNDIALKVLSQSLEEQWKPQNEANKQLLNKGLITREQYEERIITAQKLVDWLVGDRGDIVAASAYLENPLFQKDPVLQSIARRIERNTIGADYRVMEKNIPVMQRLWDLGEKIGMSDEEIGKRLAYVDTENYWENGEMKQRESLTLLNPWKNTSFREFKENQVRVLKDKWLEIKNTGADASEEELIYRTAEEDFDRWLIENWFDEVTPAGKNIYKEFGLEDEIFTLAREKQKEIYDLIRIQDNILRQPFLSEFAEENANKEIERLLRELRLLRNEYTEQGVLKTGQDLLIAQKLKEKSIIDRQIYDWSLDKGKFLNAIGEQISSIADEHTQEVLNSKLNTDNLTDLRQTAEEIAPQSFIDWLDRNTRVQYSQDFYEERKQLIEEIKSKTDSANAQVVDDLWKEITNLTSYLRDKDLTLDASDSTPEIQRKVKDFQLALENLKGEVSDDVLPLIQRLSEIQSKSPTQYYRDVMYDFLKDIYPISSNENYDTLINSKEFREFLETEPAKEFKQWFIRNHFVKEIWDEETRTKSPRIVPTYIWMKVKPSNPKDILLVPSFKYQTRELKESASITYNGETREVELKTPKIDWITWNPIEKVWLPKSQEFKNEEYEKLKNSKDPQDKLLFEYLEVLTQYHLDIQKTANPDSIIGFTVPRFHKKYSEGNIITRAWKQAADMINPREEGTSSMEEPQKKSTLKKILTFSGIESEEQIEQVQRTDYLGNEFQTVYTPYTQYLEPENVSRNLAISVTNYAQGVEKVKAIVGDIPALNLLEQMFEQFLPKKEGVVNQYGEKIDAGSNNRMKVLQHIIQTKAYGNFKDYELGRPIDRLLTRFRKAAVIGSQSDLNIPNSIKNWLQQQSLNFLFVKDGGWGSRRTLLKAIRIPKTSYANFVYEMGQKNKSVDYYILSFFNPLIEKRAADFSREARGTELQDRPFMWSATAGEFGPMACLLYSHLYHQDVTINGEPKKLYDAFTIENGTLAIKPNTKIGDKEIGNDYIQDLKLRFRMMQESVGGKQWNQTVAQRFSVWQSIEFFKRFFITMARKRFLLHKRQNIELGEMEGIYITTFKYFVRILHDFFQGTNYSQVLTPEEKRNLAAARDEFLLAIASLAILWFGFGFDEDDKNKYKKLKEKSWAENMALLIAINVKRETDSMTPFPWLTINNSVAPPIINETYNYITNPFVGFTVVKEGIKMMDSLLLLATGDDKAYYERSMPAYLIEKGDRKFDHYFWKVVQMDNFFYQASPAEKIQVIIQSQNR